MSTCVLDIYTAGLYHLYLFSVYAVLAIFASHLFVCVCKYAYLWAGVVISLKRPWLTFFQPPHRVKNELDYPSKKYEFITLRKVFLLLFSSMKKKLRKRSFDRKTGWLVGCLLAWVLWHINLFRLFNVKSIFIQIINSISNNSVYHEYTV